MANEIIDADQVQLLQMLTAAARATPRENKQKFFYIQTLGGSELQHPGLPGGELADVYAGDLEILAQEGFLNLTRNTGGTWLFDVTPAGARYVDELSRGTRQDEGDGTSIASKISPDPRNVFVVHGRDDAARRAMFTLLRAFGLAPLEWSQARQLTGKATPYVGEVLDAAFANARAVVVLLTPDDGAKLKDRFIKPTDPPHESEVTGQARPNVLFEAGMAMGRDADRTILVELGKLRPFSDIGGRHVLRFSGNVASRQELAERLRTAGCDVQTSGTDWHTEGTFPLYRVVKRISP